MTCCTADIARPDIAPDPFKRVNYTLGMVLGVDDFLQESEFHLERVRWLARDLLGYGTVRGLSVRLEESGADGWRVHVGSGAALSPSGQLICVPVDQCCTLNTWLAAQAAEKAKADALAAHLTGAPAGVLTLYLTLAYRDCPTDDAPIPGEPCRSDDELMQPSRLKDSFCLELRYAPPPQPEEDAIRAFFAWLAAIPIDDAAPTLSTADLLDQVRAAVETVLDTSPPPSPPDDIFFGSPPAAWTITREQLRAVLRLWVTELRPRWVAQYGCGAKEALDPSADAVLLAVLTVPIVQTVNTGVWAVSDVAAPTSDETERPYLLTLRVLQELLLYRPALVGSGGGGVGPAPGNTVTAEQAFGLAPNAGTSLAYSRADHTHGTPPQPAALAIPDLAGDVGGAIGSNQIARLQGKILNAPTQDGQVLTFSADQWRPTAFDGDVIGPPNQTQLDKIRGTRVVVTTPPIDGQVLTFRGNTWHPEAVPPPQVGGQFVLHHLDLPYEITAAGIFEFAPAGNGVALSGTPTLYNLNFVLPAQPVDPKQVRLNFRFAPAGDSAFVVKLTPTVRDIGRNEFQLYVALPAGPPVPGEFSVLVRVPLTGDATIKSLGPFGMMIEVSSFRPQL